MAWVWPSVLCETGVKLEIYRIFKLRNHAWPPQISDKKCSISLYVRHGKVRKQLPYGYTKLHQYILLRFAIIISVTKLINTWLLTNSGYNCTELVAGNTNRTRSVWCTDHRLSRSLGSKCLAPVLPLSWLITHHRTKTMKLGLTAEPWGNKEWVDVKHGLLFINLRALMSCSRCNHGRFVEMPPMTNQPHTCWQVGSFSRTQVQISPHTTTSHIMRHLETKKP